MGLERRPPAGDHRNVELLARHLNLFHGAPLACDTTTASPLHADGTARYDAQLGSAARVPGIAIAASEADKATKYPELATSQRVRFVVFAGEVGGRWSEASERFVRALAQEKAEEAPRLLRRATAAALQRRWWAHLAVAAQDALAATLLGDAPQLHLGRPASLFNRRWATSSSTVRRVWRHPAGSRCAKPRRRPRRGRGPALDGHTWETEREGSCGALARGTRTGGRGEGQGLLVEAMELIGGGKKKMGSFSRVLEKELILARRSSSSRFTLQRMTILGHFAAL